MRVGRGDADFPCQGPPTACGLRVVDAFGQTQPLGVQETGYLREFTLPLNQRCLLTPAINGRYVEHHVAYAVNFGTEAPVFLKPKEFTLLARVSEQHILNMCNRGQLEFVRIGKSGRAPVRIVAAPFLAMLDSKTG